MQECVGGGAVRIPAQSRPGREVRRASLALDPVPTSKQCACVPLGVLTRNGATWLRVRGSSPPVQREGAGLPLSPWLPPIP